MHQCYPHYQKQGFLDKPTRSCWPGSANHHESLPGTRNPLNYQKKNIYNALLHLEPPAFP